MTEIDRWRTIRTPPPGGADRLLRALADQSVGRARGRWAVRASVAAACSLCVGAALALHARDAQRVAFERALQASLAQGERAAERFAPTPLRELPSSRADVRILVLEPVTGSPNGTMPGAGADG